MMTPAAQLLIYEDVINSLKAENAELKQQLVELRKENELLTAGLEGARESLKPYLMVEKEAKRQIATLKECQRVSDEAYQFLHEEYRQACDTLRFYADGDNYEMKPGLPGGMSAVVYENGQHARDCLTEIIELPPPNSAGDLPDLPHP